MKPLKPYLLLTSFILLVSCIPLILKAQTNQTVNAGSQTSVVNFPATTCIYNWVNSNPAIGLPASGTGNIASFTAMNNGTTPITATITATPASSYAYIANGASNSVSVISTSTKTVIATIPILSFPTGVAVNPNGTYVYVTHTGGISFISTATNTVTSNISITAPFGIAITPDGKYIYVASGGSNVFKINTENFTTSTIVVGQNPAGVVVSPDGSKVYVANRRSGTVSVINTSTDIVVATINVGEEPYYPSVTPNGNYLYVANPYSDKVYVINTTSNTLQTTIAANSPNGIVCSPDGSKVYVTSSETNYLAIINTANNTIANAVRVGSYPTGIALTPDGNQLYITNAFDNTVSLINTSNLSVAAPINVGSMPFSVGNFVAAIPCGSPITFSITVNPTVGSTIATSGTLSSLSTSYGTVSSSSNFMISGTNITAGILVTPPAGFEVSMDDANFFNTVTVPGSGTIASTKVYIRLKNNANAATYPASDIVLSSAGTIVKIAMPNSTVTRTPISIRIFAEINYGDVLSNMTLTSSNFDFSLVNAGLKNGETATALDIILTGGHTGRDPVAVYNGVIVSSNLRGTNGFLASNYDINYVSGPITIFPAPLVITANSITKPYGSVLAGGPASTAFTVSGLQNGEKVNSMTITYANGSVASAPVATYNGSVVPSAAVGTNGFISTNYDITYQAASIVVTPIPLTATAENKSKLYNDPNPPLTVTYTGFVNGEDASQLTTQPIAATTATQGSDVGVYPITVSGGSSSNYTLSYVDGTLTVYKDINIPNTFTPNGDGINDTWSISNLNPNLKITVEIMSRYGARVYFSSGNSVSWDGYSNGVPVPFGVYYYLIKGVKEKPLTGYITVVR